MSSYSIQNQGGGFAVTPLPVTQDFDGAADLDILPALSGTPVQAGRIWCAANSPVSGGLKPVTDGWTAATAISVQLLAPDSTVLVTQSVYAANPAGNNPPGRNRGGGLLYLSPYLLQHTGGQSESRVHFVRHLHGSLRFDTGDRNAVQSTHRGWRPCCDRAMV